MSYILEALKKSQQQRELGQVPTLDASAMFSEDKAPAEATHWGLLAVGLAALAVVIALYAALRTPSPVAVSPPALQTAESATAPAVAPAPPRVAEPTPAGGADWRDAAPARVSEDATAASASPLIEPPPQPAARPSPSQPERLAPRVKAEPDVPFESRLDPVLEAELQRQLDAEQALRSEPRQTSSRAPERTVVPPDLVEDIEAFKQQVRREQGIPPPPSQGRPVKIPRDPTKLRLTPQEQAQLPAYFMTVHVFDEDASKRFVHINALKYREGEETREGFRVERITPEGAVLSYLGNPFFIWR